VAKPDCAAGRATESHRGGGAGASVERTGLADADAGLSPRVRVRGDRGVRGVLAVPGADAAILVVEPARGLAPDRAPSSRHDSARRVPGRAGGYPFAAQQPLRAAG